MARDEAGAAGVREREPQATHEGRERRRNALVMLAQVALGHRAHESVQHKAADAMAEAMAADYVAVWSIEPGGEVLRMQAGAGWPSDLAELTIPADSSNEAGAALLSSEPVLVEGQQAEERFRIAPALRERGVSASLSVVITGPGVPQGALSAYSARPRRFTEDEVLFAGAVAGIVAIAGYRQRSEAQLVRTASELRAIVHALPDLYFRLAADGTILAYEAGRRADLYMPPQEFLGRRMPDVLPPEVGEQVREAIRRALEEDVVVTLEYALPMPDGPMDFEARLVALPEREVMVVVRNVTERKRMEERQHFLAEAGRRLAASLDYEATVQEVARVAVPAFADISLVELLEEGTIHQAAAADVDAEKEALVREIGRRYPLDATTPPVSELLRNQAPLFLPRAAGRAVESLAHNEEHRRMLQALGIRSAIAVPLPARDRLFGALIFGRRSASRPYEQGDLVLAEELGRRAALAMDNARLYQEAQEAIRARDEFLSLAAHELKTPITKLRGFAQLEIRRLDTGAAPDPEQARHALRVIDRQSLKLSWLVQQILDVSRIEAGQLALEQQLTDVSALVRGVVSQAQRGTTRHTLSLQAPPALEAWVDPGRLEQVLRNLIDNATKFSWSGGPIEVELSEPAPGAVRLSVRDHGIGVPVEQRKMLFSRFFRAHPAQQFGGLGLGLYISQRIVELHGGRIEASFPPDGGMRVTVNLPAATPAPPSPRAPEG